MAGVKQSASFFIKKEAKKFLDAGPWALSATPPMAEINKSFLVLFFKKELLPAPAF
jgi:hypothetical protein